MSRSIGLAALLERTRQITLEVSDAESGYGVATLQRLFVERKASNCKWLVQAIVKRLVCADSATMARCLLSGEWGSLPADGVAFIYQRRLFPFDVVEVSKPLLPDPENRRPI